jgi:CHAT domain-containing protein/tetratricopeptide (TPR) repeat protein
MHRLRLLALFVFLLASCSKPPEVKSVEAAVIKALHDSEVVHAQKLLDDTYGKGVLLSPPAVPDPLIQSGLSQSDADRLRLLQSEVLSDQSMHQEALELLDHMQDPHDPELHVRWMVDRAVSLKRTERQDEAKALLEKVNLDSGSPASWEVVLKGNLLRGNILLDSRETLKAATIYLQTASNAERNGVTFYRDAAFMNLSLLRQKQKRYDEAADYSLKVLDTGNRRLAPGVHDNLGMMYYRLGDLEKAELHGKLAIDLSKNSGDTRTLADSLGNLANVQIEQRNFDEAVKSLGEACDLTKKIGAKSDTFRWTGNLALAHLNAANAYSNSKEPDTAAADREWTAAEKANREAYELLPQLEHPPKTHLLEFNDAEIAFGRNSLSDAEKIYRKLIDEKPESPLDWMAHARLAKLLNTRKQISEAKHEYEQALSAIEVEGTSIDRADSRISFRDHLVRFLRNYVDLLVSEGRYDEALAVVEYSRAREMAEKLGVKIDSFHEVRTRAFQEYARRNGVVLLSYFLAPDRSFVWEVDGNGIHWGVLPDRKSIAESIITYRRLIETDLRDPVGEKLPQAEDLSKMLLGPVKPYLKTAGRVIVVPDNALHTLNLETLPDASKNEKGYWGETTELSVTPSLILLSVNGLEMKAPASMNLLSVGAPTVVRTEYPELPGAKTEIAGIQKLFEGRSTVMEGAMATPRAFLDAKPESFSMIHFAAHAEANPQVPLDSAVILSQGEQGYKLYARDIRNLHLSASLVTLSACHSLGVRTYNGEGMVGFAWAFMQSGVRNVVASLWDVDDVYSSRLMISMYKGIISGKSPSAALHNAKLDLIHSASGAPLKPVYWAPFQVYLR